MIVITLISCLVVVAAAESLLFFLVSPFGILLYILLLIGLLVLWFTAATDVAIKKYALALTLVPLYRLIAIFSAVPTVIMNIDADIAFFALLNPLLLLMAVGFLRIGRFNTSEVGLVLTRLPLQIAVGFSGIPIGFALYFTVRRDLLLPDSRWYWILLGIFVVAIGAAAEELIFRGIIQQSVTRVIGSKLGLCYVSLVFAVAHLGGVSGTNLSILNVAVILAAAIFYSFVVLKSGTLLGVTISHTIANVTLFMVLPLVT